jgi:hypothetical protein
MLVYERLGRQQQTPRANTHSMKFVLFLDQDSVQLTLHPQIYTFELHSSLTRYAHVAPAGSALASDNWHTSR